MLCVWLEGSSCRLFFRQPCLAQTGEEMLGILRALEGRQSRLRALYRVLGLDPQDLDGFRLSLFEFPQLGIDSGEPNVDGPQIRGPGNTFLQRGQRLRI